MSKTILINKPIPFDLERHLREEHGQEIGDEFMPCDTITTQTISAALSKAVLDVLLGALKAEGWNIVSSSATSITATRAGMTMLWTAGVGLRTTGANQAAGESAIKSITLAYSKSAVTWAASRAGWTVKSTGDNTMTINRR